MAYTLAYTGAEIDVKLGYVNQDVRNTASPTYVGMTLTGNLSVSDAYINNSSGAIAFRIYTSGGGVSEHSYSNVAGLQIDSYQSGVGSPFTKTVDIVANADSGAASQIRIFTVSAGSTPSEVSRINSDGNFGIRTTDVESWGSDFIALEMTSSAIIGRTSGNTVALLSNTYNDSSWKYKTTGSATMLYIDESNGLRVLTKGSGTIDTAIGTWDEPFKIDGTDITIDGTITISDLTANKIMGTNGSKELSDVTNYCIGGGASNLIFGSLVTGITTGSNNMGFGPSALNGLTSGGANSGIGNSSLLNTTTGSDNTAIGHASLIYITTQDDNTAIGNNAGRYITSGSQCTSISECVLVGQDTRTANSIDSNSIVIGQGARGNGSNTVTLGNTSITANYLNGNIALTSDLESWSGFRVIEFYRSALLGSTSNNATRFVSNTYYDGDWKYKSTDPAIDLFLYNGSFVIRNVTSGTINTAITWDEKLKVDTTGIGCFGATPQAQQSHIVDADGTLSDITTKFNTLLADLEGYGLLATA